MDNPYNRLPAGWANSVRPHDSASVEETRSYMLQGCKVIISRFSGMASDGYKTDYTARPVAWLLMTVWPSAPSPLRAKARGYRLSGRKLSTAPEIFAEWARDLETEAEVLVDCIR